MQTCVSRSRTKPEHRRLFAIVGLTDNLPYGLPEEPPSVWPPGFATEQVQRQQTRQNAIASRPLRAICTNAIMCSSTYFAIRRTIADLAGDFIPTRMSEDKYHESIESIYRKSMKGFSNCYIELQRKAIGRDVFDADENNRMKVADEFKTQVFKPLSAQKNLDPDQIRDELKNLDKVNDPLSLIRVGCAFAIAAYRALKAGDEHKAWVCMCRAQVFLGRAYGARFMPLSVGRAVKKSASKHAQSGANAKHASERIVKEFALELAQRHLDYFKGANGAAAGLAPQINAYLRERERYGKEGDPFYGKKEKRKDFSTSTIRRWFKDLAFTG